MNHLSGIKISLLLIFLVVFATLFLDAQVKNQTPGNQSDTISRFRIDTLDYQVIKNYLTNVCPIEMIDIPEHTVETSRLRNWDTGELVVQLYQYSGFKISKTEITQDQWETVMGTNPSNHKGDSLPVENVSFIEIQSFINKLNQIMGAKYRLPTEFEWEYAAGDGTTNISEGFAGTKDDKELPKYAWYVDNSNGESHHVATKLPNSFGLFDMSGNVSEWCSMSQVLIDGKYTDENLTDTTNIICGGSWKSNADYCRIKKCRSEKVDFKSSDLGFRLVLEP